MDNTLIAIRKLIQTIESENQNESNDFDYWLLQDLKTFAGKTLYQLTRGEEGIKNSLELKIF